MSEPLTCARCEQVGADTYLIDHPLAVHRDKTYCIKVLMAQRDALRAEVANLTVERDAYRTERDAILANEVTMGNRVMAAEAELAAWKADAGTITDAMVEAARPAVADALGEALDCTRVWSAWSVGTMSDGDFDRVSDDDDRVDEITRAALLAALAARAEGGR